MSFALAVAVVAVFGLVVIGVSVAALQPDVDDEPPSTPAPSASRQVVAVVVAALLEDEDGLIVAFGPPGAEALSRLPAREWGTVVVERPRPETTRTLEAWRQGGDQLVLVAETPPDKDAQQVSLEAPHGPTLVLTA